jgi:hypothetical protein
MVVLDSGEEETTVVEVVVEVEVIIATTARKDPR